jgi:hexosaminidase
LLVKLIIDNKLNEIMIPQPSRIEHKNGKFALTKNTTVFSDVILKKLEEYFLIYFDDRYGIKLKTIESELDEDSINLDLDSSYSNLGEEGYELRITQQNIQIKSSTEAGIFYGLQTLKQLIFHNREENGLKHEFLAELPCLIIEDFPRFKWRGFMFDVGRHFHSVEEVKRALDLISLLKMNVFHWHLTEDQGWRIEIEKYPKLTEIGSKRNDSKIGGWTSKKYRGKPQEGYYNQEQIKEVVEYAKDRYITVVPEIEMPGHSSAAVSSYPEISCKKEQIDVPIKFGIFSDVFCPGQEFTYEFLEDVLDEILSLFPASTIHIGGDEVPKKNWKNCSDCKRKVEEENLDGHDELHGYFTNRIFDYLKTRGRRTIGWDEILSKDTDKEIIGQYWSPTGKNRVFNHLKKGGEIIVSNFFNYYLDYNYYMTPLRKTYKFNPIPKGLSQEYHKQIIGVETPIWTEWVPNRERFDWQVFPRLVAVAETAWTQEVNKDYNSFILRLKKFNHLLDSLGVKYASFDEVNPKGLKRFINLRKTLKWPEI